MNRRNLLSSLAVVGTGLALGAGLTNELYATSLIALTPDEDKALKDFQNDLALGLSPHTESAKNIAFRMAKPAKLVSRRKTKRGSELKIKNQNGSYIKVISKNGNSVICLTDH